MDEPASPTRHLDVETLDPATAALVEQALRDGKPLAIHRGGEAVAEVRVVEPPRKRRTLAELATVFEEAGLTPEERRDYFDDIERIRREPSPLRDRWSDENGG